VGVSARVSFSACLTICKKPLWPTYPKRFSCATSGGIKLTGEWGGCDQSRLTWITEVVVVYITAFRQKSKIQPR